VAHHDAFPISIVPGPPNIGGEVGPKGGEKCSDIKWRKFEKKVRTGAIYKPTFSRNGRFCSDGMAKSNDFSGPFGPNRLRRPKISQGWAEIVRTRTNRMGILDQNLFGLSDQAHPLYSGALSCLDLEKSARTPRCLRRCGPLYTHSRSRMRFHLSPLTRFQARKSRGRR
jgi:hypothetical protein